MFSMVNKFVPGPSMKMSMGMNMLAVVDGNGRLWVCGTGYGVVDNYGNATAGVSTNGKFIDITNVLPASEIEYGIVDVCCSMKSILVTFGSGQVYLAGAGLMGRTDYANYGYNMGFRRVPISRNVKVVKVKCIFPNHVADEPYFTDPNITNSDRVATKVFFFCDDGMILSGGMDNPDGQGLTVCNEISSPTNDLIPEGQGSVPQIIRPRHGMAETDIVVAKIRQNTISLGCTGYRVFFSSFWGKIAERRLDRYHDYMRTLPYDTTGLMYIRDARAVDDNGVLKLIGTHTNNPFVPQTLDILNIDGVEYQFTTYQTNDSSLYLFPGVFLEVPVNTEKVYKVHVDLGPKQ
jgi:hypothetical protein